MKNYKLIAILLLSVFVVSGCSDQKKTATDSTKTKETSITSESTENEVSHQDILDDYTKRLKEETLKLIDEYNNEYPDIQNDKEELVELSNKKVGKLAKIVNEGLYKLVGDDEGNDWEGKLTKVYTEEAQKITDVYLASVQTIQQNNNINEPEEVTSNETNYSEETTQVEEEKFEENTEEKVEPQYHTVEVGETLYRIAVNNGLTVDELKQLNGIDGDIKVGMELRVK